MTADEIRKIELDLLHNKFTKVEQNEWPLMPERILKEDELYRLVTYQSIKNENIFVIEGVCQKGYTHLVCVIILPNGEYKIKHDIASAEGAYEFYKTNEAQFFEDNRIFPICHMAGKRTKIIQLTKEELRRNVESIRPKRGELK